MTNEEIIVKAKGAKSPEELLKIAHENGMETFTEESAKAYFDIMNKSGELADEEMDVSAGGCAVKIKGRKVVTILNKCSHWHCDQCNRLSVPKRDPLWLDPRSSYLEEAALLECDPSTDYTHDPDNHKRECDRCYYCSYEAGVWYCNNPAHNNE